MQPLSQPPRILGQGAGDELKRSGRDRFGQVIRERAWVDLDGAGRLPQVDAQINGVFVDRRELIIAESEIVDSRNVGFQLLNRRGSDES